MNDTNDVLRALGNVIGKIESEGNVSSDTLVEIGEICFGFGMTDDAKGLFEEALSSDPASAKAINDLGVLHFQEGNYERARELFTRAIELNPDDGVAKANLIRLIEEDNESRTVVAEPGEPDAAVTGEIVDDTKQVTLATVAICPDPIFVVGSPRSATSQLARSLARHSENWISRESHFFNQLSILARQLYSSGTGWCEVSNTWWLAKEEVTVDEFLEFIGYGMNALFTDRSGGLRWIDHTPGYALILNDLGRIFPGARFVHMIRDGRDAANSMIHSEHHRSIGCDWAIDFERACRTWLEHVQAALDYEAQNPHRILRVHYESVSNGSSAQFRRILKFLKLPYEEATTELFTAGRRLNPSFTESERDRLKWQNSWSQEQRCLFERTCGSLLVKLGYEDDDSWTESSSSISAEPAQ